MKIKKVLLIILLIAIIVCIGVLFFYTNKERKGTDNGKIQVVVSNFATYDFLRAIIGENSNVELNFILGPGKDTHSYEPTAQDIVAIQNAELFVYIGGELEQWADKLLDSSDESSRKTMCITEYVDKMEEQEIDGAEGLEEEEGAFDEHIWTSPSNAIKMIKALEQAMEEIDAENSKVYKQNADNYIEKIQEVDEKIQEVVDNKVRDRLIFADKMPMQYFINYYGLKVSAAFPGCSTETEPAAGTIAYLESMLRKEKIPVVLYIELNDGRVAKTIADELGNSCTAMQIQTLHNISKEDFENGETWVSLMTRNIDVLKAALQ